MNSTPRSQAHRKARRDAGLVPVTVWVPAKAAQGIRDFIAEQVKVHLAEQANLDPSPVTR
jgi:hypothetical protein